MALHMLATTLSLQHHGLSDGMAVRPLELRPGSDEWFSPIIGPQRVKFHCCARCTAVIGDRPLGVKGALFERAPYVL